MTKIINDQTGTAEELTDIGDLKPFCNICGESVHITNDVCTACRSTDIGYTD